MKTPLTNRARPTPATGAADPAAVHARFMKGFALHQSGQLERAQAFYQQVLKMDPGHFDALHLAGVIAYQTKKPLQAVELIGRAIAIDPNNAAAYNNLGTALQDLERLEEALESFDRALQIKPDYAEALNNRGNMLLKLKRIDEAIASFDRALMIRPDFAQALNNRGNALSELRQFDAALDSFSRALAIKPDYAQALCRHGDTLLELRQFDAALVSFGRALKFEPGLDYLYGSWLRTKLSVGDWSDAEDGLARLAQKIRRNERAVVPHFLLGMIDSLSLQRKAAEILIAERQPAPPLLPAIPKYPRHERIRVGYYSADYFNHATMFLMAELFERHDRDRFEIVAFSFGPDIDDEMRRRAVAAFDRFIDVRNKSDREIAQLSRDLGIDIAVDLKGFTVRDMRLEIFAYRAAPVQVNYLGYPGTMGASYIDYLVADEILIPDANRQHYSEKVVYLPDSYQVNDRKREIANRAFTRAELGLPATGFVFCCFNDSYKITPQTFHGWMRLLKQVEGSVLWLFETNRAAVDNFRNVAERSGVGAERLVFAEHIRFAEHLARHRLADLFLDTLPCNAHTTASDALWAGLPVLTCIGEAFASRVGASLLNAIGLPELVTTHQEQYEGLAVELATHPERLGRIRQKLERNRLTAPLFDTPLFTRHIEDAYTQMYERHQAGLPPDHIHVAR